MAQNWQLPVLGTQLASVAFKTDLSDAGEALRTFHSGSSEPSKKVAYMFWADTTTGLMKQRNAGNTDWDVIGPLNDEWSRCQQYIDLGDLSATDNKLILVPKRAALIERIVLLSETTTAHSAGAKYVFQLRNITQAEDLFSATVGTFDSDPGIGGGAITLEVAYPLLPDQNDTVAADDMLQFQWTKTGAPANVVGVGLQIQYAER